MQELFFEFLQISLGHKTILSRTPAEDEWRALYSLSKKHALLGITADSLSLLGDFFPKSELLSKLLLKWVSNSSAIVRQNHILNTRCAELDSLFREAGFESCVLKGQGVALYYPNPLKRQSGDIDLWIKGKPSGIYKYVKEHYKCSSPVYHNVAVSVFENVPIEIHFTPSWMFNPFINFKLQRFFESDSFDKHIQWDDVKSFSYPKNDFAIVHCLVHIYRHLFGEGIGFKQLVDLHYLLQNHGKGPENTSGILNILKSLKMLKFCKSIMWIEREILGLEPEYLLSNEDEEGGKFLLNEILLAGNFGKYDSRIIRDKSGIFTHAFRHIKRNLRFVKHYPQEALWTPYWKVYHKLYRLKVFKQVM